VANRRAHSRVVLERDAADSPFDFFGIFFVEILDNVEFDVAPTFAGETVYRINVADASSASLIKTKPSFRFR
jgi:hypothetical protein